MRLFPALLLVCLCLGPGPASAQDPAPAPQVNDATRQAARQTLAKVSKRLHKVVELHADYVQRQESLLLAEPLVSKGRFHLRLAPETLVLDLATPAPARIRSDATTHRVYDPKAKRAELLVFDENRLTLALIACFRADLEQVESIFHIAGYWQKSVPRAGQAAQELAGVRLVPKAKDLAAVMTRLELVIDNEQGLPVRVIQVNAEGEAVEFELEQPQLLTKPHEDSARIFDAALPKGTRIVERRVELK